MIYIVSHVTYPNIGSHHLHTLFWTYQHWFISHVSLMSILYCLHQPSFIYSIHIRYMYQKCKFLRWNLCCTEIDAASHRCDSLKNLILLYLCSQTNCTAWVPLWYKCQFERQDEWSPYLNRPSLINQLKKMTTVYALLLIVMSCCIC